MKQWTMSIWSTIVTVKSYFFAKFIYLLKLQNNYLMSFFICFSDSWNKSWNMYRIWQHIQA